jgi:dienelactone hydrolase
MIIRFALGVLIFGLSAVATAAPGSLVNYQVDGQDYEGYYISSGEHAPLVLMVHDWDGLTGYEIKRATMLSDLGYSVFVADLFGAGVRPTKVKDKKQHTGELSKDRTKMRALLRGAMNAAAAEGADIDNAVAMGYCFGGAAVLELARSGTDLKGFVTFHGGLQTPKGQNYSNTKADVLIFHGSADKAISLNQFSILAEELEAANVNHEMISYGGAPHAFTVFDSKRYHKGADQKSWQRFTAFLDETLLQQSQ